MIVTEDEARKKWCPFARQMSLVEDEVVGRSSSWNRTSGIQQNPKCIASECMAWTWWGIGGGSDRVGWCGLAQMTRQDWP